MADGTRTGVYPCYENQFQIKVNNTYVNIADCETFEVSFDNGVEEWTPFETEGWKRSLMTGKGFTITVTAKRNIGDAGNDFVAGLAFKNGRDCEAPFKWSFPDGSSVEIADPAAVISVTNNGGGDSTNVAPLEFEIHSNGKPTYTAAA